jgi:hypothetical protein
VAHRTSYLDKRPVSRPNTGISNGKAEVNRDLL